MVRTTSMREVPWTPQVGDVAEIKRAGVGWKGGKRKER